MKVFDTISITLFRESLAIEKFYYIWYLTSCMFCLYFCCSFFSISSGNFEFFLGDSCFFLGPMRNNFNRFDESLNCYVMNIWFIIFDLTQYFSWTLVANIYSFTKDVLLSNFWISSFCRTHFWIISNSKYLYI